MNTYRVSFNLDDDDLETFLKTVGPHCGRMSLTHVYAMPEPIKAPEPPPEPVAEVKPAPVKRRKKKAVAPRKRFSKVNSAILTALQDGPRSPDELKRALIAAGMSENSLSTGTKDLMKSGKILRDGITGLYFFQNDLPFEPPPQPMEVEVPAYE